LFQGQKELSGGQEAYPGVWKFFMKAQEDMEIYKYI
jgi:hypothetical protein